MNIKDFTPGQTAYALQKQRGKTFKRSGKFTRCTEWCGKHATVVSNSVNYIDRLAQYEDTGLNPEEISASRAKQKKDVNHDMTIDEVIDVLENMKSWYDGDDAYDFEVEAMEIAVSVLRSQQEAEKNEPLTLEELKKIDMEPVYVKRKEDIGRWARVAVFSELEDIIYLVYGDDRAADYVQDLINKGAKIYRRPPEEETK